MVGAAGHPMIFLNRNFVGVLHIGNYAKADVPDGNAVVTATVAFQGGISPGIGCAGLDWRRLGEADSAHIAQCRDQLNKGLAELGELLKQGRHVYDEPLQICGPPQSYGTHRYNSSGDVIWTRAQVEACRLNLQGSIATLDETNIHSRLTFPVEAGKTYYVKWSISSRGGKMQLLNAAAGAKDMRGLNPAQSQ